MPDELEVLWEPLRLRGATLPNRVMCTATTVQYGVAGMVNDRHLYFYRERARGGVGLLFTEQLTATPLSDTGFPTSISAHDERQVERLAAVREGLDPYPTRFFGQLVAGGATAVSTGGLDVWDPRAARRTSGCPVASAPSRSARTRSTRSSRTTRSRPATSRPPGSTASRCMDRTAG